jgi:phospholipase C
MPAPAASTSSSAQVGTLAHGLLISPGTFPISHIVYIIMENHAYDNFFGVYCQKVGLNCPVAGNGIPTGTCVNVAPGSSSRGCIKPFALNQSYVLASLGGAHNWGSSHLSYDGGLMDGFYAAAPHVKQVLGYYNASTIPTYWDMAQHFGLADDFFSPALSYSLPNHWFALAGQAPPASEAPPSGAFAREGVAAPLTASEMQYLNESNATPAIDDQLVNSSVSWNYYDNSLLNVSYGYAVNQTVLGNSSLSSVFDYWNPLISKAETYQPTLEPHFVPRDQFINDTNAGLLPQVSYIIPANWDSDHPPDNLNSGEQFIGGIVGAVENSSYWKSTAIFVTWDEYGGYYDHVAPPQIDQNGLAFRVPLLVFSAYTPEGFISHTFTHFESVLHLIEWRYGFQNITNRDGLANLPLDFFDLNATPRSPDPIAFGSPYPLTEQPQALKRVTGVHVTTTPTAAAVNWSEASGGAPVAAFLVKYSAAHGTIHSVNVGRTQNSTTIPGLTCNTSYTFQVLESAGNNHSSPVLVTVATGACGPVPMGPSGIASSPLANVGERTRFEPLAGHDHGYGRSPMPAPATSETGHGHSMLTRI